MVSALSHGARAVALGRDRPLFYAGMARLAYSVPELGLRAAHEAVRRQPALLAEMIDLYRPLGLVEEDGWRWRRHGLSIGWTWPCCSRPGGWAP